VSYPRRMRVAAILLASAGLCLAAPVKYQAVHTDGYPGVETTRFDTPSVSGTIASVTTAKGFGGALDYTLTIDVTGTPHAYAFSLPPQVVPALAKGKPVTVEGKVTGGGPNARGQLAISDASGLLVAIGMFPTGWSAETGKRLTTSKSASYDETTFAVLLHAPGTTETAELVEGWRSFALAGHRFAANGASVSRELHGKLAPPDYVGSWLDFAVVRTGP